MGATRQKGRRWWATPSARVWALTAVLAALGLAASIAEVHLQPVLTAPPLVWLALAGCFLATELFLVHVDVREETYSVSVMEVPLVVGLFVLSAPAVILARLVGSAIPMLTIRRQVPMKAGLNLSLYACETAVAVAAFHAVAGPAHHASPGTWLAAFTAMMLANVVSVTGVMAAMRLHGANLRGRVRSMAVGALVPPVANTCLALVAVTLLADEPRTIWLLLGVGVVLVAAYRGYAALSNRYANLRRLYAFTQQVQSDNLEVVDILWGAAELMRAERAVLVIAEGDGYRRWCTDEPDAVVEVEAASLDPLVHEAIASGRMLAVPAVTRSEERRAALAGSGWRDCLIAPFVATDGGRAAILVADRADDVSTFDRDDEQLFATLTNHVAIALGHAELLSRLRHDAAHDALTGLLNRTSFESRLWAAIDERRTGTKLAVLLLDMDRFKEVNDTLGHHAGDELLREVARRLAGASGPDATVARLGGDEFALLLPGIDGDEDAVQSAWAVRDALRAPHEFGDLTIDLNSTIGISVAPDDGEEPAILLQRADVAMLSAKEGTGVELYRSERDHNSVRRLTLATELRAAIEADELAVHYQPKVDLRSGRVAGVEALVRWPHATRGMIPPDEFIPVAERTGAIRQLTQYVLYRAVSDCARWRREGDDFGVAVNVSTRDLLDRELPTRLSGLLDSVHLPPDALTLEITESSLMNDFVATEEVLRELWAMGIRIAIDDFGTGYSSLTYLKRLPVHEIKVDRSFVQALDVDHGDRAIVRSVIDLSTNLGLSVVAEGVETDEALDVLTDLRCTYGQGYLFSKPLPLEELLAWSAAFGADPTAARLARRGGVAPLQVVPSSGLASGG